jgi:hypothetical protein
MPETIQPLSNPVKVILPVGNSSSYPVPGQRSTKGTTHNCMPDQTMIESQKVAFSLKHNQHLKLTVDMRRLSIFFIYGLIQSNASNAQPGVAGVTGKTQKGKTEMVKTAEKFAYNYEATGSGAFRVQIFKNGTLYMIEDRISGTNEPIRSKNAADLFGKMLLNKLQNRMSLLFTKEEVSKINAQN